MDDFKNVSEALAEMTADNWMVARYASSVVGRPLVATPSGRVIGNMHTFDAEAVANGGGIVTLKNRAPAMLAEIERLRAALQTVASLSPCHCASCTHMGQRARAALTNGGNNGTA